MRDARGPLYATSPRSAEAKITGRSERTVEIIVLRAP